MSTLTPPKALDAAGLDAILGADPAKHASVPRAFTLEHARDFVPRRVPELVAGWLGEGEGAVMVGASGSYKTTLAVDIACSVALGLPWAGCRTLRRAVLVVELEGAAGLRHRVLAWHQHRSIDHRETPLAMIAQPLSFDGGRDGPDVKGIMNAMMELSLDLMMPVGFVVIDTLARAAGNLDESSTRDMGIIVECIDAIRAATGATVMLLHHTGLSAPDRGRGSSALRGATDAEIIIKKQESATASIEVTSPKMRERGTPSPLYFNAESVEIGEDLDGNPITAAVVVSTAAPPPPAGEKKLKKEPAAALAALEAALVARGAAPPAECKAPYGTLGVLRSVWHKEFESRHLTAEEALDTKMRSASRSAFNRGAASLEKLHLIVQCQKWAWLAPRNDGDEFELEAEKPQI